MKKVFFIVVLVFLGLGKMNAQLSFSHSGGVKIFFTPSYNSTVNNFSFESESRNSGGVLYSPRINFVELDNSTFSLGTHIGLAFQGEFNSNTGGSSSFTYDIPVVFEYNFGLASNNDNFENFGFYVGAGYGIHNSGGSDAESSRISGLVANAGLRFYIIEQPIDINFSYLKGSGESKDASVIGLGVQYMLGL
jgi:hypothetical protein